jgi:hypothetical protein
MATMANLRRRGDRRGVDLRERLSELRLPAFGSETDPAPNRSMGFDGLQFGVVDSGQRGAVLVAPRSRKVGIRLHLRIEMDW